MSDAAPSATLTFTVAAGDTARAFGSGEVEVLATPRLLAWCEAATCAAAALLIGDGDRRTSVGTRVRLDHLLATPVGGVLQVSATLDHEDGRLLHFAVHAVDRNGGLVATGEVTRVVVERERFAARVPPA